MKQIKTLLMIGFFLPLTGCWDAHEIQELNFVTIMGIDYRDEKYILYVQMLDFSTIAKQETGKPAQLTPLYIGKGSGRTIIDAVNNLYQTSQQKINWAHLNAIIYSESVLQHGIEKVEQSLKRYGEFRYTPWMFGTKEPIEKILSTTGFFQTPPIYTILFKPTDTYNQYSYIKPMRFHQFISKYKEPGGTALLPSISIDENDWREPLETSKPKITQKINGAFPVSKGEYKEWLSYEELSGLRWTQAETKNTNVDIIDNGKIKGTVQITAPSSKVNVAINRENVHFNIKVKVKGTLIDLEEQLSLKKIEALVTKQIEKEIWSTYENGIDKKVDVYNLKNSLFHNRVNPDHLKNYPITGDSLKGVEVNFQLESKSVYN
ncbi:Ger(x)C family spore germination protein [Bacillus sp. HNG]|uniref:Ger(x)C family spore germination protein n=1 Tax=Bacillus sp. HNG TaxID=2293325 RepID=UPI000E2F24E3|nr:Ger(x)C family spore germination protein [Bacillus sp. HNG]RFB14957.1 Ger(x)C family spore germination protein [Bacillus sp. HNG]